MIPETTPPATQDHRRLHLWTPDSCPPESVGCAIARTGTNEHGDVTPVTENVVIWLIDEGQWRCETVNTHVSTGETFEFKSCTPRCITELRTPDGTWLAAGRSYRQWQDIRKDRPENELEPETVAAMEGFCL